MGAPECASRPSALGRRSPRTCAWIGPASPACWSSCRPSTRRRRWARCWSGSPEIPGVSAVEVLVVDDGSTDADRRDRARSHGAAVMSHGRNLGVGAALQSGLAEAVRRGVSVAVNIDSDGQFSPEDIPRLAAPVIEGRTDFVTASRFKDPSLVPDMPRLKLWGNWGMSRIVSGLGGPTIRRRELRVPGLRARGGAPPGAAGPVHLHPGELPGAVAQRPPDDRDADAGPRGARARPEPDRVEPLEVRLAHGRHHVRLHARLLAGGPVQRRGRGVPGKLGRGGDFLPRPSGGDRPVLAPHLGRVRLRVPVRARGADLSASGRSPR